MQRLQTASGFRQSSEATMLKWTIGDIRGILRLHKIYQTKSLGDVVIQLFNRMKMCFPIVLITFYKNNQH